MWTEHNTPCSLVILLIGIYYIYIYIYIYTYTLMGVHMYIYTKVLSSVFSYRMWLPNSVVPVSWQDWSEINTFGLKVCTIFTMVFLLSIQNTCPINHAACCPMKSPKLNVNIQHLSVSSGLWVLWLAIEDCAIVNKCTCFSLNYF